MDTTEAPPQDQASGQDDSSINQKLIDDLRTGNDALVAELEALNSSYQTLLSKSTEAEENLAEIRTQRDEILKRNVDLVKEIEEVSRERDSLRDKLSGVEASLRDCEDALGKKIDESMIMQEKLQTRVEELLGEKKEREKILLENLGSLETIKESLIRVIDSLDEEKAGIVIEKSEDVVSDEELRPSIEAIKAVSMLASMVESKVSEYQEMRKKEKRELENSVVSLTEENRDINSLLRIALVEKDAVEKSLNRLKGNSEQKRVALLQIAERGLQKVGFGFMMGSAPNEVPVENLGSNAGSKSDSSECEEEVVSLASTVERIMKNLRQEITQLRRSLEESRSDTERLQSLTEKQAQKIAENTLYIKELEDREMVLAQNVEELLLEMKETEEEVARWREACELEVEAGKNVVGERDKVTLILKQELENTKTALDISNGKLKLKEDLAAAAMAAQAAAERSLQLADSRAAELRERIEELTRQLEEAESRDRNRLRVRHVCWPWRALKVNPASNTNTRVGNVRRMLPEMQALLH
ncbi:uncharacterized protein At3g49055 [Vitis riparia]|uniref:uncharacterized protein At3g49055 n=1 Tax=Vitis riparia TaxID=96939 RepID=UPI00155AEC4C|nr:uncharacterized protein At3g49055 [Vitis riparia]